jgi:hypothetical protein
MTYTANSVCNGASKKLVNRIDSETTQRLMRLRRAKMTGDILLSLLIGLVGKDVRN